MLYIVPLLFRGSIILSSELVLVSTRPEKVPTVQRQMVSVSGIYV